jgi:hypothetical protein
MGMKFNNNSSVSDYVTSLFTPYSRENSIENTSRDDIVLGSTTNLSLSVNYLPSKFSEFRNRKLGKYDDEPNLPKTGGGLLAFKINEARMSQGKGRLRWNKFKWILFCTNIMVWFL